MGTERRHRGLGSRVVGGHREVGVPDRMANAEAAEGHTGPGCWARWGMGQVPGCSCGPPASWARASGPLLMLSPIYLLPPRCSFQAQLGAAAWGGRPSDGSLPVE